MASPAWRSPAVRSWGGVLTQMLSWHSVFWLNVPIGVVAVALSISRLDESYGPASRIDMPAAALVSGGAVGIVLGLVRAADSGWSSPDTVASLGLGILLMAGFVAWELRATDPMLPMRLFRNVTFSAANATAFFMSGSQFAAAFLIAQYFQLGQGYSPMDTGLRVLPWTATPLVVAPLAGALSDRVGRRPLMLAGMILQALGFLLFDAIATSDAAYWQTILPLVVSGIGVSMVLPVTPAAILSAVAPIDMGRASAVNNTLQRFGTAFGVAVATAVFIANGSLANPATFADGLRPALLAVAVLSILGAVAAVAVGRPQVPEALPSGEPASALAVAA